jgi:hypothetical protein
MIKKVVIIFKTHLDIGYTDLAEKVADNYLNVYIPKAIDLAYKYKGTNTPFVWTTGAWLIYEGLKKGIPKLEQAINDGLIVWHGLPFTSHTELMNEELFEYGLSISQRLDERFGKKTISAKMTDVPGHTRGMIPYLAKAGIEFLHIGVNEVAAKPNVPNAFIWQCGESSIRVVYNQGGYGGDLVFGETAIVFAHTNDNLGPQSEEGLLAVYQELWAKYPEAEITAGSLNDLAKIIRNEPLPTFSGEIGDTWIHGAGTDPWKIKAYREVLRRLEILPLDTFEDNLLLVPEHTCGLCVQRYYPDVENYELHKFESKKDDKERIYMERSWREQREYVIEAGKIIGFDVVDFMKVSFPELKGAVETDLQCPVVLSWELFDNEDFEIYKEQYLHHEIDWGIWDNTKVGLPKYQGLKVDATQWKAYRLANKNLYILGFSEELNKDYGLPMFIVTEEGGQFSVKMFCKRALRLHHAFWLKFRGLKENWEFTKLNNLIKPEEIVGSPLISAIDGWLSNGDVDLYSYDAPLIAPYGRNLLRYGIKTEKQDLYFNLYNNIWNTNFPLWYNDDIEYRFKLTTHE